jgi:hypothetical protein
MPIMDLFRGSFGTEQCLSSRREVFNRVSGGATAKTFPLIMKPRNQGSDNIHSNRSITHFQCNAITP